MIKTIRVFSILMLYLNSGCGEKEGPNCHRTIIFNNVSNKELVINPGLNYPDTIDFANSGGYALNEGYWVQPNEINKRALRLRYCWESYFEHGTIPSDTLMIFVFDAEVVKNIPWIEVYKNYHVLKRYDLSLSDLHLLNWRISYPPTELMQTIKQYPPYESE